MTPTRAQLNRMLPRLSSTYSLKSATKPITCRHFTNNALYQMSPRSTSRPQLPFLSSYFKRRRRPSLTRLLSTEQKADIKYQIRLGIYWTFMGWTLLAGVVAIFWIGRQHWLDQLYPSPDEWYILTRYHWRNAKHEESSDGYGTGIMDWGSIGTRYRAVVGLLEDYKFIIHRPSGLRKQDDIDPTVPGLDLKEMHTEPEVHYLGQLWASRIGFDIMMKSEPWRRGYYEAMMGLAKGAEMRAGWMTHKLTGKVYPPEHVKSAENPYPKPMPPGAPLENPDISECWPTLEAPDFHYKRILTTTGFNRKQRLDAGLAYAGWLEHAGKHELAEQMLKWSLDMAIQGLGTISGSNKPAEVVDPTTGVIPKNAPYTTPNILETATAMANHHARLGDIKTALPIYLSILRARRAAPVAPPTPQYYPQPRDLSLKSLDSVFRYLRTLPWDASFPPPPANGDEVFERRRGDECAEAALMVYVGEILFAKAGQRKQGLSWTHDAVEIAERAGEDSKVGARERKVCEQCVGTGLLNLKNMTAQLKREADEGISAAAADAKPVRTKGWLSRLTSSISSGADGHALLEERDWFTEEQTAEKRLMAFEEKKLNSTLSKMISGTSSWFVV